MKRSIFSVVMLAALLLAGPAAAQPTGRGGQGTPPPPPEAGEGPAISAGQIQRWFEAYTVLQAQEALGLTEAQYGRFVTRLKALQEIRRRHQQARNKILNDLRQLTTPQQGTPASPDETVVAERLRALRDEDDRVTADLRKAYDGVDETLSVTQQARFRTFEERMEQQKLELLLRARQNARANRARGKS